MVPTVSLIGLALAVTAGVLALGFHLSREVKHTRPSKDDATVRRNACIMIALGFANVALVAWLVTL